MKQIILGTAGHIDHGKTSLIKALTGIETDRLKEEKLRGITIELGFASITLPKGELVGIVDVPGHEKFVKNMVAGASGIDIVAMVIAADEGVMPQTKEHMDICNLMGIKYGFIALTKIDLVDDKELMELVLEDIKEFTQNTFLENAPVIALSSTTGKGLDDFVKTLDKIYHKIPERVFSPIFRLPVDRVFSMKGFGTVITGTIVSGKINVGDNIMIFPLMTTSKVRGIQVHGKSVNKVSAGTRTAINFQGLDKESVNRGDVLSTPHTLRLSYMVDCEFSYLSTNPKPIKSRTKIRFHCGTREILGNLILLDREELISGEKACVQIRLESEVCCVKDDRFVIRSYSPIKTLGGGKILNPVPLKHKIFDKKIITGLNNLVLSDFEKSLLFFIDQGKYFGTSFTRLKIMTNLSDKKLDIILQKMLASKKIILADKEKRIYVHYDIFKSFSLDIISCLEKYHKANPLKEGMSKQELKSKFRFLKHGKTKIFSIAITKLVKNKKIIHQENIIKLENHKIALKIDQKEIKKKISLIYKNAGLKPPFFRTICKDITLDEKNGKDVLYMLIDEKIIIKTKDDLYFNFKAVAKLEKTLVSFLQKAKEITTPQFKDMAGVSRKFVIPLIEYFDSINLTIRIGDTRQLRQKI
ncbi:MAG: selenocysteine-specific translation elongation factor [Desulfobacteraceae bacterium 4572_130]|nr:MAG: selenocysteine-specific translation elongation factor [Desulfobacteraceae bacterium 4572_130]